MPVRIPNEAKISERHCRATAASADPTIHFLDKEWQTVSFSQESGQLCISTHRCEFWKNFPRQHIYSEKDKSNMVWQKKWGPLKESVNVDNCINMNLYCNKRTQYLVEWSSSNRLLKTKICATAIFGGSCLKRCNSVRRAELIRVARASFLSG